MSAKYIVGVDMFMDFAIETSNNGDFIRCSCIECKNLAFHSSTTVRDHLFFKRFDESYTIWTWHGEAEPEITKNDIGDQANPQNMYLNQGDAVDMIRDTYNILMMILRPLNPY